MFGYDTETGEIWLYEAIGPAWAGMIDYTMFHESLLAMQGRDLTVRISSPGGSVWESQKMASAMERYAGKIVAEIDALAASAATHIMVAADTVRAHRNSQFMIHKASVMTWGNVDDHNAAIDMLSGADANQIATYAEKTGKSIAEIQQLIESKPEVWMTSQEALDAGFIDEIIPRITKTPADVPAGMYAHTPQELLAQTIQKRAPKRDLAAMRLRARR